MTSGDPSPTPASYLEKLRDVPAGQVLLGVVGVHGCSARAVGRRRGSSRGWDWQGAVLTWMRAGQGPLSDSRAAVRSALPSPPRPRLFPCLQRAAAASRARGSARGGARRRTTRPTPAAAASLLCALGPRLQSPLQRPPVTLCGQARGAGVGRRGLQSVPRPQHGQGTQEPRTG